MASLLIIVSRCRGSYHLRTMNVKRWTAEPSFCSLFVVHCSLYVSGFDASIVIGNLFFNISSRYDRFDFSNDPFRIFHWLLCVILIKKRWGWYSIQRTVKRRFPIESEGIWYAILDNLNQGIWTGLWWQVLWPPATSLPLDASALSPRKNATPQEWFQHRLGIPMQIRYCS